MPTPGLGHEAGMRHEAWGMRHGEGGWGMGAWAGGVRREYEIRQSQAPCLIPLASYLIPHTSYLIPHASCLIPHASCLMPHPSCLMPHASYLTPVPHAVKSE